MSTNTEKEMFKALYSAWDDETKWLKGSGWEIAYPMTWCPQCAIRDAAPGDLERLPWAEIEIFLRVFVTFKRSRGLFTPEEEVAIKTVETIYPVGTKWWTRGIWRLYQPDPKNGGWGWVHGRPAGCDPTVIRSMNPSALGAFTEEGFHFITDGGGFREKIAPLYLRARGWHERAMQRWAVEYAPVIFGEER